MNGEATRFKTNNKAAEKWTFEEAENAFEAILKKARDEGCKWLCIQEAVLDNKDMMPHRTFYYLLEKFPVLRDYKKELNDIILSKVNRGTMEGEYPSAPGIWRMKMLGERETTETINTTTNINVDLNEEQKEEALNRVKDGLNEFKDYE